MQGQSAPDQNCLSSNSQTSFSLCCQDHWVYSSNHLPTLPDSTSPFQGRVNYTEPIQRTILSASEPQESRSWFLLFSEVSQPLTVFIDEINRLKGNEATTFTLILQQRPSSVAYIQSKWTSKLTFRLILKKPNQNKTKTTTPLLKNFLILVLPVRECSTVIQLECIKALRLILDISYSKCVLLLQSLTHRLT